MNGDVMWHFAIGDVRVLCLAMLLVCNLAGDRVLATVFAPVPTVAWDCVRGRDEAADLAANGWWIARGTCSTTASSAGLAAATVVHVTPPEPTNLRASLHGTTVQLDWDQPSTAVAWQVEALRGGVIIAAVRTTAATLTVTGVPQGSYVTRVRSATPDFSVLSPPSNEVAFFVNGCSPQVVVGAPTALGAWVAGNQVTLGWRAPAGSFAFASPAESYILEVGSAPGLRDLVALDTQSPATRLQATAPGGVYYARVYAKTSCGTGPTSNEVRVSVPSMPEALPPAPIADFDYVSMVRGQSCSARCFFTAVRSTGTGLTYHWDFADGSTATGPFVTHVYASSNKGREMTVVLTVSDAFGRTSTMAKAFYISFLY
jgi:hypothetical protein